MSNRIACRPHRPTYYYDILSCPIFVLKVDFIFLDSNDCNRELSYDSGQIDYLTHYRYLTI